MRQELELTYDKIYDPREWPDWENYRLISPAHGITFTIPSDRWHWKGERNGKNRFLLRSEKFKAHMQMEFRTGINQETAENWITKSFKNARETLTPTGAQKSSNDHTRQVFVSESYSGVRLVKMGLRKTAVFIRLVAPSEQGKRVAQAVGNLAGVIEFKKVEQTTKKQFKKEVSVSQPGVTIPEVDKKPDIVKRWTEVLSNNQLVQISSSSDRSYYSSGGYRSESRLHLFSNGLYSWGSSSSVYLDTYSRQSGPAGGARTENRGRP